MKIIFSILTLVLLVTLAEGVHSKESAPKALSESRKKAAKPLLKHYLPKFPQQEADKLRAYIYGEDLDIEEYLDTYQKMSAEGDPGAKEMVVGLKLMKFFKEISSAYDNKKIEQYLASENYASATKWFEDNYKNSFDCRNLKIKYMQNLKENDVSNRSESDKKEVIGYVIFTGSFYDNSAILSYRGLVLNFAVVPKISELKDEFSDYYRENYMEMTEEIVSFVEQSSLILDYSPFPEEIEMRSIAIGFQDSVGRATKKILGKEKIQAIKLQAKIDLIKRIKDGGCEQIYPNLPN